MNTFIYFLFSANRKMGLSLLMLPILALTGGYGTLSASVDSHVVSSFEEMQQNPITLRGVITDASTGEALIGANVVEKGTTNGTVTHVDGSFQLDVQSNSAVLVISYIGYQTVEVPASGNLNISLSEDTELMEELVVIGYGTQRKGDVTSAISSVKAEDFTVGKIGDAADLIKGKIAGLSITKGSGDPNHGSTIRLRGVISLEGSSTPLVLIDGIEGNLGTVAPENIASIDVLKDASAAAIYGTRGANGVILITTKSGNRGAGTVANYAAYTSLSMFGKKLDFYGPEDIRLGKTNFVDKGYDTDWLDAVTRTAMTHNHNFNVRGGTDKTTYSADFTFRNEDGVIMDTYSRDIKANLDVSHWMFNDMLRIQMNIVKGLHENSATNASNADASNIYRQALIHNPTEPIWNNDGTYYENFQVNYYYNPVGMIKERIGSYNSEWTRLTGNITFEPINGWQTNLMVASRLSNAHNKGYYTSEYYSQKMENHTGYAYHSFSGGRTDNLELTSKYHNFFGNHRVDGLVGYSYQYNVNEGFNANNYDFQNDFFQYNNLGVGLALKDGKAGMGSYKNDNRLIGFFGRISYGYDDRYNLLLSVRQEGSSKFGENHKWGTFPSASFGWTVSNESFMEDITWVNNLKLRAGYGVTGVIPNNSYQSLTRYALGSSYYYENGVWKPGLVVASNPNPDLKWEKSEEVNIGLDLSTLNDRLGASIDLYSKHTNDMLWWYSVPAPPNLYKQTLANVGEMSNKGIEVAINAVPFRTNAFEWKSTLTGSFSTNKLISLSNDLYETANEIDDALLGEPITIATQRLIVGKTVGQFYGLKSVGVSENGLWMIENPSTGEAEEFTDNMLNNDVYRQYLGNSLPKVYMGWNNTFFYKDFDLSMQFTGQFGFDILNEPRAFYENNSIAYNRLKSVEKAPYSGQNTLSTAQKQTIVSYYMEKGDFVKLTNLTLGYTVPLRSTNYVKGMRIYLSGDNLFTITGYSGLDPELSNSNPRSAGIDWRDRYPSIRSFTCGVNITF